MFNIRAHKTTQNKDDLRVLFAGIFLTIFLIVAKPYIMVFFNEDPKNCSYPHYQK